MNIAYFIAFIVVVLISSYGMYYLINRQISHQKEQLDDIHELVNSNLSKVKADLEIALDRISTLEALLSNR